MKNYTVQLVLLDENMDYPKIYTDTIKAKSKTQAVDKLYEWTYTITEKSSDEYEKFEMYINGLTVNQFII